MDINFTQIFLQGLGTGVGAVFGTVFTFIVMRYFPKVWGFVENSIQKVVANGAKNK